MAHSKHETKFFYEPDFIDCENCIFTIWNSNIPTIKLLLIIIYQKFSNGFIQNPFTEHKTLPQNNLIGLYYGLR